jgi:proline iminopeptidase
MKKLLLISLLFFALNFPVQAEYLTVDGEKKIQIYYKTFGNPNGTPVIFLHGGPGGEGVKDENLKFYDLKKYFVVLFDQRGCGKSIPEGVFVENNTKNLIEDIEQLRRHLNLNKFILFGHSWGSTLALLYGQKYPQNLLKLIVSGIFLGRVQDDEWLLQGNKLFFPDFFEDFASEIKDKNKILDFYYNEIVLNKDIERQKIAVTKFLNFGNPSDSFFSTSQELQNLKKITKTKEMITQKDIDNIQIFLTYAKNLYFINEKDWLTRQKMSNLDKIPTVIIKGRYDFDSPLEQGFVLSKLLPSAKFIINEGTGHGKFEKKNFQAITKALKNN